MVSERHRSVAKNPIIFELYSVVEGDVSLASVAKELGFDGRELTDILDRLPVEEALGVDANEMVDEENGFLGILTI